jgi:hypothetical protein
MDLVLVEKTTKAGQAQCLINFTGINRTFVRIKKLENLSFSLHSIPFIPQDYFSKQEYWVRSASLSPILLFAVGP